MLPVYGHRNRYPCNGVSAKNKSGTGSKYACPRHPLKTHQHKNSKTHKQPPCLLPGRKVPFIGPKRCLLQGWKVHFTGRKVHFTGRKVHFTGLEVHFTGVGRCLLQGRKVHFTGLEGPLFLTLVGPLSDHLGHEIVDGSITAFIVCCQPPYDSL